ncbi:MAG: DNA-binding protein [Sutterella sp.]|jgi:hypothetical protein|uniref:Terminase small subunit n=1 Tax=Myoviridae sp. ctakU3 TaxID=2825135 RepID=A0A8S5P2F6_9CAUD|nr:MAG TPA: terminase small subunit [Myoviridae sp. ctakU3]
MPRQKIQIDLRRVETLASRGLTFQQIAEALGISLSTLESRRRESKDFEGAIKRGKAKGIAQVSNLLFEQCKAGNVTAQIFFLKTQGGWTEKTELKAEITQKGEAPQGLVGIYAELNRLSGKQK